MKKERKNGRLKIVYLLPAGLFNSGGMERVTTIKANYLAELGHDVSIVTTEQMGRPVFYPLSAKVHLYHLDIGIYCNFGKENYLQKCISRYRKTKEYKKRLNHLLLELRPDITVSTLGLDIGFINDLADGSVKIGELHFPGNFRELMARKLSTRFLPNYIARIRTGQLRRQCGKLEQLVVLTEEERSFWSGYDHVSVIANPLPFLPATTSSLLNKQAIAVGRLAYEKGFDMLIEAWETVSERYPDWGLHIYGTGDQKEGLMLQTTSLKLQGQVTIHDAVNDIHRCYLESSLMLFPSRYLEAFPMVLLEASSSGLPMVAFDAPCGPKDLIRDGENGFLVKTGDKQTFAEKICSLIESVELRKSMGDSAMQKSMDYTIGKVMPQWLELFDDLISRSHRNVPEIPAGAGSTRPESCLDQHESHLAQLESQSDPYYHAKQQSVINPE